MKKYTGEGGDVVIPEGVTSIGRWAFEGCDNLVVKCHAGSYTETYAKENGIKYEIVWLQMTDCS